MNYKMTVTICDPNTQEGMTSDIVFVLNCSFAYDEDTYGNGYHLAIEGEGYSPEYYDLRYDSDFHKDRKMAYLVDWAQTYWNGKNGAYKVKSITIAEA